MRRLAGALSPIARDGRRRRADEHQAGVGAGLREVGALATGSRSRGAPRRRRCARAACEQRRRCSGRTRRPAPRRCAPPRRPAARAARRRRRRCTPPPCGSPARVRRAHHAAGDLAAVGDQDLAEQHSIAQLAAHCGSPASRLALLQEGRRAFDALRGALAPAARTPRPRGAPARPACWKRACAISALVAATAPGAHCRISASTAASAWSSAPAACTSCTRPQRRAPPARRACRR